MGRSSRRVENFIPEVRPGNQTALNTRPPLRRLHRPHAPEHPRAVGLRLLEDLDRKSIADPQQHHLMTKVEIVLNPDGTISKVTVIKASGWSVRRGRHRRVYSAGPYADPPREIRSGNGKIYITGPSTATSASAPLGRRLLHPDNAPAGGDKGERRTPSRPGPARPSRA
jgi:hypothetical protein